MRKLITIVENAMNEGKMSTLCGMPQMGYWYNPSTGASVEVSWADGQHHSDEVIRNSKSFGFTKKLSPDYFFERDMGDINGEVIRKFGWVRIALGPDHTSSGISTCIEAKSLRDIHKALEFAGGPCVCLDTDSLEWFLKKGTLPKGIQF